MKSVVFRSFVVIFVSFALLVRLTFSEQRCKGINPYKRVYTSAVGKWHLTRGIQIGGTNESRNACGFFNTVKPCKCIGVKISSNQSPPNITNYTLTNFGYNAQLHSYATTDILLSLISANVSIYNAYVPLARLNFTIAILGTDDFASWMSLIMCDDLRDRTGNVGKLIWVITRSPQPSQAVLRNASQVTGKYTNSTGSPIISIDQSNCPGIF